MQSSRADPALRALDRALDAELMLPLVAQAAGLTAEERAGLRCSPDVLNHKPGRRCTIRYTLARSSGQQTLGSIPPVIGKLYRSRDRAMRAYERMEALGSTEPGGCGVPSIPACLMPVRSLGLFFQECVDGTELDHVVASEEADAAVVLAARWLLRLHASPRLAGLRELSFEHALTKVDDWCTEIAARLSPSGAAGLRRARDGLHELAAAMPGCSPAMIHRDFYHAQVLWNGQRIWVLDFDELCVGDPALDVGHFLAHLEYKAYLWTGRADAFQESEAVFAGTYRESAPIDPEPRLPFYRAYTFLKLAHTEVARRRGEWRRLARVLLGLAGRALDGGAAPWNR
ncbi:MAG: phosphotransferase [Myxococcota bacterium]